MDAADQSAKSDEVPVGCEEDDERQQERHVGLT